MTTVAFRLAAICFMRSIEATVPARSKFQTPHAAAGPDVDVVDRLRRQLLRAPDVVDVVGVASVNENVAGLQPRLQIGDGCVDRGRRAARSAASSVASSRADYNLDGGVTSSNLSYVIYTSGSTGRPKGV